MPKIAVFNMEGSQVEEIDLDEVVFGSEFNEPLVHSAVVMQLASRRVGTQSVKTRAEVRGGGRKPWRQKGTGRARAGSTRSPLWRSGGVVFAPKPRNYKYSMPKKAMRAALRSVLSAKVNEGNLIVLENLKFDAPKTKEMVKVLDALKVVNKALVVTAECDVTVHKSARNIENILPISANGINVYDVLNSDKMIITKDALSKVEEVLA